MSKWTGVVTNAGNSLLNEWSSGKTLQITKAEAGTGTVEDVALLAQTAVSGPGHGAVIAGRRKIANGVQLCLQISAQEENYTLHQLGVWAELEGGMPVLLALFQNRDGIPISSKEETPDFAYTFYGVVVLDNTGKFKVNVDTSALVTLEMVQDAVDRLTLGIMTNELTLPLAAGGGEELLTDGGTPLQAVYHPDKIAGLLESLAALDGRLSGQITRTASEARAYADGAGRTALAGANAYTDGKVLELERRMDTGTGDIAGQIAAAKSEAVSAASADTAAKVKVSAEELTRKITAAKSEAIAAASTDTAAKISAHNVSTAAHPTHLAIVKK